MIKNVICLCTNLCFSLLCHGMNTEKGTLEEIKEEHDKRSIYLIKNIRFYETMEAVSCDLEAVIKKIDQLDSEDKLNNEQNELLEKLFKKQQYLIDQYNIEDNLIAAVLNNNIKEVACYLANPEINVNIQSYDGETPLHCATLNGFEDIAELLMKNNANMQAQDHHGLTPLSIARRTDQKKVISCFEAIQKQKREEKKQQAKYKQTVRLPPSTDPHSSPSVQQLMTLMSQVSAIHAINCVSLHTFMPRPNDSINHSNDEHKDVTHQGSVLKTKSSRKLLYLKEFS